MRGPFRCSALLGAAGLALAPLEGATAVGLGPLVNEGVTRSERKGFYLVLLNPYREAAMFRLTAYRVDDETIEPRILLPVSLALLGGRGQRRILVVDTGLKPGEIHRFRVCAERVADPSRESINARVCSRLTSRRLD